MTTQWIITLGVGILGFGLTWLSATPTETCFSKGERSDGSNKICYYSCPSGNAAITIKSWELCPVTIKR